MCLYLRAAVLPQVQGGPARWPEVRAQHPNHSWRACRGVTWSNTPLISSLLKSDNWVPSNDSHISDLLLFSMLSKRTSVSSNIYLHLWLVVLNSLAPLRSQFWCFWLLSYNLDSNVCSPSLNSWPLAVNWVSSKYVYCFLPGFSLILLQGYLWTNLTCYKGNMYH